MNEDENLPVWEELEYPQDEIGTTPKIWYPDINLLADKSPCQPDCQIRYMGDAEKGKKSNICPRNQQLWVPMSTLNKHTQSSKWYNYLHEL